MFSSLYLKSAARLARWSSVAVLAGAAVIALPQFASAQTIPGIWEANYQPPSGIGAPRRVEGGASRDGREPQSPVGERAMELTALVPTNNQFGVTVASHPTIHAYMPKLAEADSASIIEFELVDAENNQVYFAELEPVDAAGVVGIRIPDSVSGLEVGNAYRWTVTVYDRGDEVSGEVGGLIQRVAAPADLQAELASASTYEQAMLYVERRLWYDALATLATLQRDNPSTEVRDSWTRLLRSAGLEEIAPAVMLSERLVSP